MNNKIDYLSVVKISKSKSDFALRLGFKYHNGKIAEIINGIIKEYNLDISHFKSNGGGHNKKYEYSEKICPVCLLSFTTQIGRKTEKITCSHSCSNKYFSNRRRKDEDLSDYSILRFRHHKKECVICKEKNIVGVHHYDENHENNIPENLIPMCPTHHQYWHSRFKFLVEKTVTNYRNEFIKNRT